MSSLAEQVKNIESDNAQLLTAKTQLEQRVAELEAENGRLMAQCDAMVRFTAGTRAMVETLANDAYELLRASKREVYEKPQGEGVEQFAPRQAPLVGAQLGVVRDVREVASARDACIVSDGIASAATPIAGSTLDLYAKVAPAVNLSAMSFGERTVKNILDAPARPDESKGLAYLRRDSEFDVAFVEKGDPYATLAAEIAGQAAANVSGGRVAVMG